MMYVRRFEVGTVYRTPPGLFTEHSFCSSFGCVTPACVPFGAATVAVSNGSSAHFCTS